MSLFRSLMISNIMVDPLEEPITFTSKEAGATVTLGVYQQEL